MQFIVGVIALAGLIAYFTGINFIKVAEYTIATIVILWLTWIITCAVMVFTPLGDRLPAAQKQRFRGKKTPGAQIEPPNTRRREDAGHTDSIRIEHVRVTIQFSAWGSKRGIVTTRTIVPYEMHYFVDRKGITVPTAIEAYCELRKEMRTFRYRRIMNAYDPITGEIIDNLGEFLWNRQR